MINLLVSEMDPSAIKTLPDVTSGRRGDSNWLLLGGKGAVIVAHALLGCGYDIFEELRVDSGTLFLSYFAILIMDNK